MGNIVAVICWDRSIFGSEFDNKIYDALLEVAEEYGLAEVDRLGATYGTGKKYFGAEIAGVRILWYGGRQGAKDKAQEFMDAADALLKKDKIEYQSHIEFLPM